MTPGELAAIRHRATQRARMLEVGLIPTTAVDTYNDVPALLIEVNRLEANMNRLRADHRGEIDRLTHAFNTGRAEVNRLTAELRDQTARSVATLQQVQDERDQLTATLDATLTDLDTERTRADQNRGWAERTEALLAAARTQIGWYRPVVDAAVDMVTEWGNYELAGHRTSSSARIDQLEAAVTAYITAEKPDPDPTPTAPTWLWDQRIPLGALTVITGTEGSGKSLTAAWLAARVTRGQLPGLFADTPCNVVWINGGQDDPNTTVVPRLIAAGADTQRVMHAFPPIMSIGDKLATLCADDNVALLIVDPLTGGLADDTYANLTYLAEVAAKAGVAVVTTTDYRTSGHTAMEVAPNIFACRGNRLVHLKSTLGMVQPDKPYHIEPIDVELHNKTVTAARIAFLWSLWGAEGDRLTTDSDDALRASTAALKTRIADLQVQVDVAGTETNRYRIELEAREAQVNDLADLLDQARTERDRIRYEAASAERDWRRLTDADEDTIAQLRRRVKRWKKRARGHKRARVAALNDLIRVEDLLTTTTRLTEPQYGTGGAPIDTTQPADIAVTWHPDGSASPTRSPACAATALAARSSDGTVIGLAGPCVLTQGHDGNWHQSKDGRRWVPPVIITPRPGVARAGFVARSCPTCHSIGTPKNACTDPWHTHPTITSDADADTYLAGLLNNETATQVPVNRVDPDHAADDDWTEPDITQPTAADLHMIAQVTNTVAVDDAYITTDDEEEPT